MTREEAAMKLSLHLMQCGMLMPIEWVQRNGEGSELSEAFRMALAALREQPQWISERDVVTRRMIELEQENAALLKDLRNNLLGDPCDVCGH